MDHRQARQVISQLNKIENERKNLTRSLDRIRGMGRLMIDATEPRGNDVLVIADKIADLLAQLP